MATVLAFDAGKTIVEDAAIKIAVDHLFYISTEEAVVGGEPLVLDLLKFLKVIFNAPVRLFEGYSQKYGGNHPLPINLQRNLDGYRKLIRKTS